MDENSKKMKRFLTNGVFLRKLPSYYPELNDDQLFDSVLTDFVEIKGVNPEEFEADTDKNSSLLLFVFPICDWLFNKIKKNSYRCFKPKDPKTESLLEGYHERKMEFFVTWLRDVMVFELVKYSPIKRKIIVYLLDRYEFEIEFLCYLEYIDRLSKM